LVRFARFVTIGCFGDIMGTLRAPEPLLSRAIGIAPAEARLPALMAGACFQFFKNRSYTFRAQAGNLSRQAWLFVLFEAVTLGLNFGLFRVLLPRLPGLPPEVVTFIGSFVVFVAFAYPVRRLVIFKLPGSESARPD
jgi:putative flippase GtrA